ncbi:hypothetical protein D3C71_1351560 [compost metagenome]
MDRYAGCGTDGIDELVVLIDGLAVNADAGITKRQKAVVIGRRYNDRCGGRWRVGDVAFNCCIPDTVAQRLKNLVAACRLQLA